MSFVRDIIKFLKHRPKVSNVGALAAGQRLAGRADKNERKAIECMCEIIGFAATCNSHVEIQKFIVWQEENGPILKDESPALSQPGQPEGTMIYFSRREKELLEFLQWLTPCGQVEPPPTIEQIGLAARILCKKIARGEL
jgi:hypothetical protein